VEISVSARHMDLSDDMRDYVQEKCSKLAKHYDGVISVRVLLEPSGTGKAVEIVVRAPKGTTLVVSAEHENMRAAVDAAIGKAERRVTRLKEKLHESKSRHRAKPIEKSADVAGVNSEQDESQPAAGEEE